MTRLTFSLAILGLSAALGGATSCSRIETTVDVYRGELPSQRLRALELHDLATRLVATTTPVVEATVTHLQQQCQALTPLRTKLEDEAEQLKSRSRTPEYIQRASEVLASVGACTGATTYDAEKCRAMASEWTARKTDEPYILHTIARAHAPGDAEFRALVSLAMRPEPPKTQKAAYTAAQDALARAHKALREQLPADFKLTVDSWAIDKTTYHTEVEEPLAALHRACEEQQPVLEMLARELTSHGKTLKQLVAPGANATAEQRRTYNLGVSAEVTSLQALRLDLIARSRTTAEDIRSASTLFDRDGIAALRDVDAPDDLPLMTHLKTLGELRDTLQVKLDPRDHNIPEITRRCGMDKTCRRAWNRVDVDRMRVGAAGRSRYIVVQDSPINFRLKELNSDPTSVVKFGLTAGDIGLEVLSTVITKGAVGKGGAQDGAEPVTNPDPEAQARLAEATTTKITAVRGNLLRDLAALEKELPAKPTAQQLKEHAARLTLLLEFYEGDLADAAAAARAEPASAETDPSKAKE